MWQFQIKFLDKYIRKLKKNQEFQLFIMEQSGKVFQETSLIKFQMFWRKLKKSWKKNKTIHTVFKISTDLFQVRHGSLSLQTNTRKINKQENVNKQCQTSFLTRKKNKENPGKIFRKIPENSRKLLKIPGNSRKLQEVAEKFQKIPGKKSWKHPGKKSWGKPTW